MGHHGGDGVPVSSHQVDRTLVEHDAFFIVFAECGVGIDFIAVREVKLRLQAAGLGQFDVDVVQIGQKLLDARMLHRSHGFVHVHELFVVGGGAQQGRNEGQDKTAQLAVQGG